MQILSATQNPKATKINDRTKNMTMIVSLGIPVVLTKPTFLMAIRSF